MAPKLKPRLIRGGFVARKAGGEVAATAALTPGVAGRSARVTPLRTTPTYDPTLPPDQQFTSHGQMVLNLQAAIDALMAGDIQSYSLPTGVSVTKKNPHALMDMIQTYKRKAYFDFYGRITIDNMGMPYS